MISVKGLARLTRASRRALRRTRQRAYWQRELAAGGQLEPAYFTLLLRWSTWLIALLLVVTGTLIDYDLPHAPELLVLTGLWLLIQTLYLPVLRTVLRSAMWRYRRVRAGLVRMVDRGSALCIVEVLFTGPILYLTGGYGSPFYLYAVSSIVMPALLFGYRAALAAGAGVGVLYLLAVLAVPGAAARLFQPGAVETLVVLDQMLAPLPLAVFAAYLGQVLGQVEAERDRSRLSLQEARLLQGVTASGLRHVADPDRFLAQTLWLVQRRRWLRAFAVTYRRPTTGAPPDGRAAEPEAVCGFGRVENYVAALQRGEPVQGRSVLTLPLRQGSRHLGTLIAAAPLVDERLPFLTALAGQLSAALANAHLYAETQALAAQSERARLAREIHDGVAQSLFMLTLNLEACVELAERDPARLRERLELLNRVARQTLWETRHYLHDLKPLLAHEQGLCQAIENLVTEFRTLSRLAVDLTIAGEERAAAPPVRQAVYRITQEGLANIFKHARAEQVEVALRFEAEGIGLTIVDDGQGLPPEAMAGTTGRGFGLGNMRERAAELGGRLTVTSAPGAGTRLEIWVPYQVPAPAGR